MQILDCALIMEYVIWIKYIEMLCRKHIQSNRHPTNRPWGETLLFML